MLTQTWPPNQCQTKRGPLSALLTLLSSRLQFYCKLLSMRFSATFLRGIYFIYSVALCVSQLVYFAAVILLHFQYVSFVVAVVVVACCTQSFNPNVLFATTLSYAHSSNHNRSNKQRQRQQAQKQQHSCAGSVVCLARAGLAWLGQHNFMPV